MTTKRRKTTTNRGFAPDRSFEERGGVLMTREECADYLGVKPRHVRTLVETEQLPVTYVGDRHPRIHIDDVRAFIELNRVVRRRGR